MLILLTKQYLKFLLFSSWVSIGAAGEKMLIIIIHFSFLLPRREERPARPYVVTRMLSPSPIFNSFLTLQKTVRLCLPCTLEGENKKIDLENAMAWSKFQKIFARCVEGAACDQKRKQIDFHFQKSLL